MAMFALHAGYGGGEFVQQGVASTIAQGFAGEFPFKPVLLFVLFL